MRRRFKNGLPAPAVRLAAGKPIRDLCGRIADRVAERSGIRTTTICPGAIKTELLNTVAPSETKAMVEQFYENVGLEPEVIADAVVYALSQPDNVGVNDLVVRPSLES